MRQLKITKSITNRESASLDKYLQEIGREELVSPEEEVELSQRIRKGDQKALEKLTSLDATVFKSCSALESLDLTGFDDSEIRVIRSLVTSLRA